jgi:hypothetical protein
MKRLVCLAMLCTAVLGPRAAFSQQGATSLSLRPFGETTIGLWHRFTPRLELGLQAGAVFNEEEADGDQPGERRSFLSIQPAAKLYGVRGGALRPYGYGAVFFSSQSQEFGDELEIVTAALGAAEGMGLEWSPVERVRIGGHAGVSAAILDGERTRFELGSPIPYDVQGWEAHTFTSGLTFYYSF